MRSESGDPQHLFGSRLEPEEAIIFFSAHLDEAGVDGKSPFAILGGAVATTQQWNGLSESWNRVLQSRGITAFHNRDVEARRGEFSSWGPLKRKNFVRSLDKTIEDNSIFEISVAVHRDAHLGVKKAMQGVRNFKPDSDVGMCFRLTNFLICQALSSHFDAPKVQFIVEDGPYSAGMRSIYEEISASSGSANRTAMYGDMHSGFASLPKGQLRSLEAADRVCGRAMRQLKKGTFLQKSSRRRIAVLADEKFLRAWHEDIHKERERRSSYANSLRKNRPASSDGGNPE